MYTIYQVSGPEGKVYIGQTVQGEKKRFRQHIYESRYLRHNNYFHNCIRKYGEDCFKVFLLDTVKTLEEANYLESLYIHLLNTTDKNFGYNSCGGGREYYKHSPEIRQKIKVSLKAKYPNGRISPNKDKKVPLKTREQISKTLSGRYRRENHSVYLKNITPEIVFKEFSKCKNISEISRKLNVSRRTVRRRLSDYNETNKNCS